MGIELPAGSWEKNLPIEPPTPSGIKKIVLSKKISLLSSKKDIDSSVIIIQNFGAVGSTG
jgi:hypothetical protein